MKGRNNTWTDTAAAAAFAAVLGISAFWGQHDRAYDQALKNREEMAKIVHVSKVPFLLFR